MAAHKKEILDVTTKLTAVRGQNLSWKIKKVLEILTLDWFFFHKQNDQTFTWSLPRERLIYMFRTSKLLLVHTDTLWSEICPAIL